MLAAVLATVVQYQDDTNKTAISATKVTARPDLSTYHQFQSARSLEENRGMLRVR